MEQKIKFPQVGQTLSSGYTVIANYNNRYVLAFSEKAPDPYVVWNVYQDGNTVNGRYRSDLENAQKEFTASCFPWFYEPVTQDQITQAFDKVIEKFISFQSGEDKPARTITDAQDKYKYELNTRMTVLEVYSAILQALGHSAGRKWMVRFIKNRENAALYQSLAMRQAHFDALYRLNLSTTKTSLDGESPVQQPWDKEYSENVVQKQKYSPHVQALVQEYRETGDRTKIEKFCKENHIYITEILEGF